MDTIRFKLTLIYSLITFTFVSAVVTILNIYLNNYLKTEPPPRRQDNVWIKEIYPIPNNPDDFIIKFEESQRRAIHEIRMRDLQEIQRASLFSIFPAAILSFTIGYIISGKFLSPISRLQKEIALLNREDLGKTIPIESPDEVGKLIESFNELSLRLKNAFEVQERFVQDAQHELKTPLTIIQTNLDVAHSDPSASKTELKEAISNSLEGIKIMKKLTTSLFELTVPAEHTKVQIDMNKLIERQINILSSYAASLNVTLTFNQSKQQLLFKANEISLERAIFNIIENAIKYSAQRKNAEVKVSSNAAAGFIEIKVIDNGPGIALEHQQKIFERFYRVDKSRSRKTGGFGLGLAIAKKFIQENNGEIQLKSEPGHTEFTLLFKREND